MSRRRDRKGKGKGKGKGKSQRRPRTAKVEWVGGLVQTPFTIESNDGGASYEPLMALWVERPGGFVVAHELLEPGPTQGRLGAALDAALAGVGLALTANAPTRIRVATQELAAEVRDTLGPGIPIIVAPTPELDEVMSTMGQALGGSPTTLFPSPAITPDLVERFFVAARALWAAAPWRFAGDAQIIRVDAPSLGIDGACLSILGAGGQEFGLSLFESIDHYDAFMRVASSRPDPARRIDLGGEELLLSFDHERNVPKKMVTQARELGLATASENAFPTLCRVSRDASFGPPSAQDYALMTALAAAVGTFTAMHRELFEKGEGLPARRTFEHDGAPAVTLTAPYDVMYLLDEPDAIASPFSAMGAVTPERTHGAPSGKIGRNEPCPCGSGK
ncbi:MAG TPA: hypothetical protein ENK57_14050, partial [Polyangiaceae bacterium]|nr:hypothetical protein [Polyangiaceae bacterium]